MRVAVGAHPGAAAGDLPGLGAARWPGCCGTSCDCGARSIDANLQIAFPQSTPRQRQAIALGMWEHLLVMLAEIAHAPRKVHRTNWRRHSHIPDMALMARRLLDRRPVVMISGHLGNFEMGGYMLGLHGFPTHTIARKLDNPYLDRWINRFREATGQYMLAKDGSSHEIDALLKSGGTLALLGDQHAGKAGCWVDFFGKPASTHKAVALFTLASEAPTATVAMLRRGEPMHFEMCVAELDRSPRPRTSTWARFPLVAAVVHAATGGTDPLDARPVLVAAPAVARAVDDGPADRQATAGRRA